MQTSYDIRVVQEMMGPASGETTMIYFKCSESWRRCAQFDGCAGYSISAWRPPRKPAAKLALVDDHYWPGRAAGNRHATALYMTHR